MPFPTAWSRQYMYYIGVTWPRSRPPSICGSSGRERSGLKGVVLSDSELRAVWWRLPGLVGVLLADVLAEDVFPELPVDLRRPDLAGVLFAVLCAPACWCRFREDSRCRRPSPGEKPCLLPTSSSG
jgi:hypothetical protein